MYLKKKLHLMEGVGESVNKLLKAKNHLAFAKFLTCVAARIPVIRV